MDEEVFKREREIKGERERPKPERKTTPFQVSVVAFQKGRRRQMQLAETVTDPDCPVQGKHEKA